MSDIEDQMVGTPLESLKILRDTLTQFKTTPGFKVLVKLVRDQEANLLRMFMSDEIVDMVQLRADFRAWQKVLSVIDEPIQQYDIWLEGTLEKMKQQENVLYQNQGGNNVY